MKRGGKGLSRADSDIAKKIKYLMEQRHWDQKDLAEWLDLSEGYVSRILSGERPWPVATLFKAARAFEVPVTDLDDGLEDVLRVSIADLELREDLPQAAALTAFVTHLPRITNPGSLDALERVLEAFATRLPRRA
jgi:transcriptional regulator with XRE-family HTH domain